VSDSTTTQCLLFPDLFDKPFTARFDQHHGSSDGGAVLLKAADRRVGLTEALADCLIDQRQPGKVVHESVELLSQRVYGLACGYPDCNDAGRLAADPIHKALVGRDPIDGEDLASQSTLSRFENSLGGKTLYRMGEVLLSQVIERHRRRRRGKARVVTIDLDVTDDTTHGQQQLSLFNGFYHSWCYLPLLGFISFDDEPDQYLVAAMLRPGNASTQRGALGMLRRVVARARQAFPGARLMVRLDGGFACPELFDWLDEQPRLDYVVAIAKNKALERLTRRLMAQVRKHSRESGCSEQAFGDCTYAAATWPHKRRVVIKAEVVRLGDRDPRDNPRFVITNLRRVPRGVYDLYRQRGEIENRIKELQLGLEIDRTSCCRFWANQFRVLLTAAAYVLMQELRLNAKHTDLCRAQIWTLRERLLKLGTLVEVSVRRVLFHLPASFPFMDAWCRTAKALGARAG
jgi:hypothetical protein